MPTTETLPRALVLPSRRDEIDAGASLYTWSAVCSVLVARAIFVSPWFAEAVRQCPGLRLTLDRLAFSTTIEDLAFWLNEIITSATDDGWDVVTADGTVIMEAGR